MRASIVLLVVLTCISAAAASDVDGPVSIGIWASSGTRMSAPVDYYLDFLNTTNQNVPFVGKVDVVASAPSDAFPGSFVLNTSVSSIISTTFYSYSGYCAPKIQMKVSATIQGRSISGEDGVLMLAAAMQWNVPPSVRVGVPFVATLRLLDGNGDLIPNPSEYVTYWMSFSPNAQDMVAFADYSLTVLNGGHENSWGYDSELFVINSETQFHITLNRAGIFFMNSMSYAASTTAISGSIHAFESAPNGTLIRPPNYFINIRPRDYYYGNTCAMRHNCTLELYYSYEDGKPVYWQAGTFHFTSSDPDAVLPPDTQWKPDSYGYMSITVMFAQYSGDDISRAPTLTATSIDDSRITVTSRIPVYANSIQLSQPKDTIGVGEPRPMQIVLFADDSGTVLTGANESVWLMQGWGFYGALPVQFLPSDGGVKNVQLTPIPQYGCFEAVTWATSWDTTDAKLSTYVWPVVGGNLSPPPAVFPFIQLIDSSFSGAESYMYVQMKASANGSIVNYSNRTIKFTSSDARVQLPPSFIFPNSPYGMFQFRPRFYTPGTASITVTDAAEPTVTATAHTEVWTGTVMWKTPSEVTAGKRFTVHLGGGILNQTAYIYWSSLYGRPRSFQFAAEEPGEPNTVATFDYLNSASIDITVNTPGTYQLYVYGFPSKSFSPVIRVKSGNPSTGVAVGVTLGIIFGLIIVGVLLLAFVFVDLRRRILAAVGVGSSAEVAETRSLLGQGKL